MINKRLKSSERKNQIMEAARLIAVRDGSENITIKRIAKEVGITEGAIYKHFASKNDLLEDLLSVIERNLLKEVKNHSTKGNALDKLENILMSHISQIEQRKGISFQVIAEIISLGNKDLNRKVNKIISLYIDSIKSLLIKGIQKGEIKPNINPEHQALIVFSTIQGLVNLWTLSNYKFNLQEEYSKLWRSIYEGLANQTS